ncbi:mitochondrial import inner membrane translocase subunit [Rhizoctonia solani]|nr:mitochondrial import inner membrane translocase subunit [Rhizoctonia solani]
MADHSRDPCPYVILHEAGAGFVAGAVGGGIWHGIKGARRAPKGLLNRLEGATHSIKARSPVIAGNFGAWTGLLYTFDCAITGYRQKDDIWNRVFSGIGVGGCLSARGGPRSALSGAFVGGVLIGVFECAGVVFTRYLADGNRPQQPLVPLEASPLIC